MKKEGGELLGHSAVRHHPPATQPHASMMESQPQASNLTPLRQHPHPPFAHPQLLPTHMSQVSAGQGFLGPAINGNKFSLPPLLHIEVGSVTHVLVTSWIWAPRRHCGSQAASQAPELHPGHKPCQLAERKQDCMDTGRRGVYLQLDMAQKVMALDQNSLGHVYVSVILHIKQIIPIPTRVGLPRAHSCIHCIIHSEQPLGGGGPCPMTVLSQEVSTSCMDPG